MPQNKTRNWLFHTIFGTETYAGRLFDIILLILIIASVVIVIFESVTGYRAEFHNFFFWSEWIITIIFTIEYILRIYSSPRPHKYILSFFGIVDFLAILPTYLSLIFGGFQYLMLIRILRLLRVFRILKLVQFVENAELLSRALKASIHKITVFVAVVFTFVVIVGALMYVIEGEVHGFTSIPKSIYWTIVTITTVGYGDITPQTNLGKILASFVMLTGYAIIAVPTGIVTVELSKAVSGDHNKSRCINCNHLISTTDHYCSNCGIKVFTRKT